uniref:Uncharacterized protein n=1 Tax=Anguilla anguilla TaxID=7936 RepID=A0A0E9S893_ANGAN
MEATGLWVRRGAGLEVSGQLGREGPSLSSTWIRDKHIIIEHRILLTRWFRGYTKLTYFHSQNTALQFRPPLKTH